MHDPGPLWLAGAAACALLGMAWLALAMPVHAQQAWGGVPRPGQLRALRLAGAGAVSLCLGCCLGSDHASMAVLVWVMLLGVCAIAVATVLAFGPRALRHSAPWIRSGQALRPG